MPLTPREILEQIALDVESDISSNENSPNTEMDTSFDLWIEELRGADGDRHTVGVIDMGDLWQGVYLWNGAKWELDASWGEPQAVIDRIIKNREYNRGL